ncbi:membrane hypothetical protein [uncultured delta proteobacterium]|uniref:Uncharacterized protein n=1 Tax=uncultured delta proteobacterium TaxID=34034 RepID=A0A212J2Q5_9DELT|nr:membrane hypothetical protein [uncultured delta proteobacterium]
MTALSCIAYAAWIFLAAFLFRGCLPPFVGKNDSGRAMRPVRDIGVACLAAGAFFFVPPGSLPPFLNYPWGGLVFLGCLALSALLARERASAVPLLLAGCVALVFFWYARQRGMPGSAANLGTFTGMPVWGIAPARHICGFLLLAAGFLAAARALFDGCRSSHAATLRCFAVCALFVALFAPWNTAPYVRWPDSLVAGCDFMLFWGKVFGVAAVLLLLPPVQAGGRRLSFFCCTVGSALIIIPAG